MGLLCLWPCEYIVKANALAFHTHHKICILLTKNLNLSLPSVFSVKHSIKMISAKKLIKLARKWQKLAAIRRKRITLPKATGTTNTSSCSTSKAEKGYFAVYSADQKRFLLPLEYLNNEIIRELFNMAEDEFGLPSNGPLILTWEAEIIEYAISLIKRQVTRDIERALLTSIASSCCLLSSLVQNQATSHQLAICSF